MIKVRGVKCLMCGDTVISRSPHDYHTCSCGNAFMDGGQEGYYRAGGVFFDEIKGTKTYLDTTLKDLYDDWNNREDKYGIIKDKNYTADDLTVAKAKVLLKE